MKVLKDNYVKASTEEKVKVVEPYPRTLVCENCSSELEYEESDLRIGAYGSVFLDCPCCGNDNIIENHENEINLTMDNVEFPVHFHHTSKENGAIDVCNDSEIRKCIQSAIKYFRKNKDEFVWQSEHGNMFLIVFRYEGDKDYEVIVTDNFYSTYIPFEDEDYE